MISQRYYMIRAFYDWITDNLWTPYILVNASYPNTVVPQQFVENGKVVLDVSFNAVRSLEITHKALTFSAMFGSKCEFISVPVGAIEAIYSHETMQGMNFIGDNYVEPKESDLALIEGRTPETCSDAVPGDTSSNHSVDESGSKPKKKGPPNLRVVD